MATFAVLNAGQVVGWRDIADWENYPAHKKAANDEKGDGGPVLRLRVVEGDGPNEQIVIESTQVRVVRSSPGWADLTREQKQQRVNVERDRRMQTFTFGGVVYDFDPLSRSRIDKAKTNAMAAIELGAQPNNYRWADPNIDFGWITAANGFTLMDAQTALAFGLAAAAWEGKLIVAARNLKDMQTIPEDHANDSNWPSS